MNDGAVEKVQIDIIVAVSSEENEIPSFIDSIESLQLPDAVEIGIIFVEDSSRDGTVALIERLSRERPDIDYYSFRKGYGQGAAVAFGLSRSEADAMITMDVDGEHPPELVPDMIESFLSGDQLVQCVRKKRTFNILPRKIGSWIFNKVASVITGIDLEEQNVYFRLVSSNIRDRVIADNRWPYFMRMPAGILKKFPPRKFYFDVVADDERVSKYSFWRLAKLSIDGVMSMIPAGRLYALVIALLAIAVLCAVWGNLLVSAIPAAAALALLVKFISLARSNPIARLEVAGSSREDRHSDSN